MKKKIKKINTPDKKLNNLMMKGPEHISSDIQRCATA
jgi:hypothetical protein